ncbi:hypothetical protein [Chitinivibrio alkaliphilus]|uniref:hypothetical protein n=1 Tax=Chitinivibrio alkaliphilus TaxID=1505232 RepID=UPI0004021B4C|nr:hypothetical protein [Chitinivibrio alkaliphilus]
MRYSIHKTEQVVRLHSVGSNYGEREISGSHDPYGDLSIHRQYRQLYCNTQ